MSESAPAIPPLASGSAPAGVADPDPPAPRWSVAIFTSREDADLLLRTVAAVVLAAGPVACTIDVLVDGNPSAAEGLARWEPGTALPATARVRVWLVDWRDKACTWNRYLHELAPDASIAFFVDGYVRPAASSFAQLADALAASPHAWAATAVPTVGPSAAAQRRRLLADGGLHGNLYALRGDTLRLLKARGFRLPLGLYRNDSLLGAVVCFGADPAGHDWDPGRIAVVADATWTNDLLPAWSVARVRGYLKRRLRQVQGSLENAAVRDHLAVARRPPEDLPATVAQLVHGAPADAESRHGLVDRMLMRSVRKRLAATSGDASRDAAPRLLRVWNGP